MFHSPIFPFPLLVLTCCRYIYRWCCGHCFFLLFIHGLCPPLIWIDMIDWFWCWYIFSSVNCRIKKDYNHYCHSLLRIKKVSAGTEGYFVLPCIKLTCPCIHIVPLKRLPAIGSPTRSLLLMQTFITISLQFNKSS